MANAVPIRIEPSPDAATGDIYRMILLLRSQVTRTGELKDHLVSVLGPVLLPTPVIKEGITALTDNVSTTVGFELQSVFQNLLDANDALEEIINRVSI
jgi:hypothetical protein